MRLPPMLSSLTRHKLVVMLMVMSTALSCGVIANIAVMFVHRVTLISAPSGVDEARVLTIDSSRINAAQPADSGGANRQRLSYLADVDALRGIHGVASAAVVNGVPFGNGTAIDISAEPGVSTEAGTQVTAFSGGHDETRTLGVRLTAGRDFIHAEFLPSDGSNNIEKVSSAIISVALSQRLFHTDNGVGRFVYFSGHPIRVVGIVAHLVGMAPAVGAADNEFAMMLPLEPDADSATFVINAAPHAQDRVFEQALAVLARRDPNRVLDNAKAFPALRAEYFRREGSMVSLLLVSGLAMLIVTAGGIVGLTSFWVLQRTRGIGIRRAVGATKAHILSYFLVENFLIVTAGVFLGWLVAYSLNFAFIEYFEVPVLPFGYIVAGSVALWLTGQAAGLGPALRAASVPPVVATRAC